MTTEEKEAFYDQVIAPELGRLGKLCEERGISFLAMAEWAPGESGLSLTAQAERGLVMMWTIWAATCRGNADALIGAIARRAGMTGHSSIMLKQLGVPLSPAEGQTVQ